MRFDNLTLYVGDDEIDEYGDSSAYGESLEEDLDEEEEEEEEPGVIEEAPEPEPVHVMEPAPPLQGGGGSRPPRKKAAAKKKATKKKAARKAKKKPAKKAARKPKKKAAKKKASKKKPRESRPGRPRRKRARARRAAVAAETPVVMMADAGLGWLPPLPLFPFGHHCLRFNFHQHLRRDQRADRQQAGGRPDFAEELAVRFPDLLPVRDIGDEHARADNVA